MTDKEAYKLIGDRAQALTERAEVQKKMIEIATNENKEAAVKWLYMAAIATLCGMGFEGHLWASGLSVLPSR